MINRMHDLQYHTEHSTVSDDTAHFQRTMSLAGLFGGDLTEISVGEKLAADAL